MEYSIKDLLQKYELKSRQSIYDWLKTVGIEVQKRGNESFVDDDAVAKLDELKAHLEAGGTMKNFTPVTIPTVHSEIDSQKTSIIKPPSVQPEIDSVQLMDIVKIMIPQNPISHWEKLDKAMERGYLLTTKEIKELLGTKPHGKVWIRGAFEFTKVGKIGNQVSWKITRIKPET